MKAQNSSKNTQNLLKLQPYQEIPFSPFKQLRPILVRINSDSKMVSRNHKVRTLANKAIEGYFATRHGKYRFKQNSHLSSFKIKTKKKDQTISQSLQNFFQQKSNARHTALRKLHEDYLAEVRQELGHRRQQFEGENQSDRQQKIIDQYNIVYEYKVGALPAAFL